MIPNSFPYWLYILYSSGSTGGNSGGSSELLMDEDENVMESFLQDT